MASGKSNYLEDKILNAALLNGTALAGQATLYVALYTLAVTPGQAANLNECTDTNYARVPITSTTGWAAPSLGVTSNSGSLSFFGAGAVAGQSLVALAIVDGPTKGTADNVLYFGDLTGQPKTINIGDTASIAIGALSITEA